MKIKHLTLFAAVAFIMLCVFTPNNPGIVKAQDIEDISEMETVEDAKYRGVDWVMGEFEDGRKYLQRVNGGEIIAGAIGFNEQGEAVNIDLNNLLTYKNMLAKIEREQTQKELAEKDPWVLKTTREVMKYLQRVSGGEMIYKAYGYDKNEKLVEIPLEGYIHIKNEYENLPPVMPAMHIIRGGDLPEDGEYAQETVYRKISSRILFGEAQENITLAANIPEGCSVRFMSLMVEELSYEFALCPDAENCGEILKGLVSKTAPCLLGNGEAEGYFEAVALPGEN
ncbi:MAG: hypothetical protein GX061_04765 [Eubacteriaceae bacterium]|nr:hypothetical protein [Eubacteriaceae bacterium]